MTESQDPGKEWRQERGIPIVASFDAYRALAVIGVVLFHIFEVGGVVAAAGDSAGGILIWGVLPRSIIVFFVVSGFVMFLPTSVRGGDFGRVSSFAIGRVARIVPAYWLSLLVALVLLAVLVQLPPADTVFAHFTMLQTPALLLDGPVVVNGQAAGSFALGFGVIPPVWTMSVETAFYLVLPFVAAAFFRRPFVGLASAAGLLTLWQVAAVNAADVASVFGATLSPATEARFANYYASQFPSWAFSLACGMTIAWLYVRLRDRVPARLLQQRALLAVIATVPAVVAVVYLTGQDAVTDPNALNGLFARQPLLLSFAYPLVMAAAMLSFSLAPARVQRPLANEPMRRLADISYSVYLIHFAVIWFALKEFSLPTTGSLWSSVAWSALVFPVSIVYAWLSANLLERPVRRWANKFRRRGQASSAPPSATQGRTAAERPSEGGPIEVGEAAPPVSIVVSTYNRPAWLRGAMDSVLAQDYPNLELFVVDDGSSDQTPDLLADYAKRHPEERFRFLCQENAGQARALNRGNELARGEILGYLSDDDLLAPGAVSRLAGELIADPSAAVAYPEYLVIDEHGVAIDAVLPIEYSPLAALRLHDTIIGPGGLTRRWALESAGGWDPELRFMGDLILWMGVGLAGRAIRVAEPLASWRRHPGSATVQRNVGRAREHLAIVERGLAAEGFPSLSSADYAEALRNACLFAALMCGEKEGWPDRFAMFDLHPKRISAFGSGYGPEADIDWAEIEENARLYRDLVLHTVWGAEARAQRAANVATDLGGVEAAIARLRAVGALPGEDGSFAEGIGERDLRLGLLEAALACGEVVDPQSMRFFLLDHDRVSLSDSEESRVVRLGYSCTVERLRTAIRGVTSGASTAAPEGSS